MVSHCYPWLTMDIHGQPLISMVNHGRSDGRTVGRSDGRTVGRSDGRSDGRTVGRTVGRSDIRTVFLSFCTFFIRRHRGGSAAAALRHRTRTAAAPAPGPTTRPQRKPTQREPFAHALGKKLLPLFEKVCSVGQKTHGKTMSEKRLWKK